ncbi:MAG TPA: sigma factor [Chlorobiota bacterium]|nr:sigma factor [Chlorobiota bacterium]
MTPSVNDIVNETIRTSYGRLLAILASESHDVMSAEDALSEAVEQALISWHSTIPSNPPAWLLTVARRRMVDVSRRAVRRPDRYELHDVHALSETDVSDIPDERLRLLFVCAHPSIAAPMRTALMLQCVLGLSAETTASAMLVSPATMSQRLVRVKAKIRDAGISFDVPPKELLSERLQYVLDAIYAVFTSGMDVVVDDRVTDDLATEALYLSRLLTEFLPMDGDVWALHSLMLSSHGRKPARVSVDGTYVPLHQQDFRLWNADVLDEAEHALRQATLYGARSRYMIEAMISSAHSSRRIGHQTPWPLIVEMYHQLIHLYPSVGAQIARAVAIGECRGYEEGLTELLSIPQDLVRQHQPYWAALYILGKGILTDEETEHAKSLAIGLSSNPAIRAFFQSV